MKPLITFVNHASVIFSHGDVTLITDPWISGTAFNDSWELISQSKLQGANSYDIMANRQYAIAFAAEEEEELIEAGVDTTLSSPSGGDIEMVANPLKE